jgi:hypothetical protein
VVNLRFVVRERQDIKFTTASDFSLAEIASGNILLNAIRNQRFLIAKPFFES